MDKDQLRRVVRSKQSGKWLKDVCLEIQDILHYFGAAKDPLLESSRLLEQSQAHFIAALRYAATQSWRISGAISFPTAPAAAEIIAA